MSNKSYEDRRFEEFIKPLVEKIERYAELSAEENTRELEGLKAAILVGMPDGVNAWISHTVRQGAEMRYAAKLNRVVTLTHERATADKRFKVVCDHMLDEAALLTSHATIKEEDLKMAALRLLQETIEVKLRPLYREYEEIVLKEQRIGKLGPIDTLEAERKKDKPEEPGR